MNKYFFYKDKNVVYWWCVKDTDIMSKLYWQNITTWVYGIR